MLQTGTPCLEIEGLVKDVGPVPSLDGRMKRVLAGVDLTANLGQITVLLGVNGAGKTTTLECAQGLQKRTHGVVRLLGQEPEKADAALRSRVGIMLQEGGLPPSARPLALLRHVAGMYTDPLPVDELAERLGIHEFASTTIRRLSGGQKQRVALAAALIGRPEVVFLDEPSAGLDPQSRQLVVDLIDGLRKEGLGVILTTHLLDDAERLADVVHILDHGRVVASGTVAEILAGRRDVQTRLTLRAQPGLPLAEAFGARSAKGAELAVGETSAGLYTVDGELTPADLVAVTSWLAARSIMPETLELGRANLQDVFLAIAAESALSSGAQAPTNHRAKSGRAV